MDELQSLNMDSGTEREMLVSRPTLNPGEPLMTIEQVMLLRSCAEQLDQCDELLCSNNPKLGELAAHLGGMSYALMELSQAYENALDPVDLAWNESVPHVDFKWVGNA